MLHLRLQENHHNSTIIHHCPGTYSNNLVLIFVAHSVVWTGWGLEEEWWRLSDWILWAQLYYYKRSVWFLVTKSSGCIVSSSGLAKHRQSGGIATGCHHFENVRQEREQRVVCFKWTAAFAVAMESKLISLMDGMVAAGCWLEESENKLRNHLSTHRVTYYRAKGSVFLV